MSRSSGSSRRCARALMREAPEPDVRVVKAVHGVRVVQEDPEFERGLSDSLRGTYSRDALYELYGRFVNGDGAVDKLMRRAIWRAAALRFGDGVQIGVGVGFKH